MYYLKWKNESFDLILCPYNYVIKHLRREFMDDKPIELGITRQRLNELNWKE
ncbi:hypothetical protein [Bacillus siamensis]|uniref:hypothetical protein n=1 Tax=Bacillus siamensis TaxID=659243 RepID=UPI00159541B9|nr:hypothetical protein [Bacillus siamensis]